MSDRFNVKGRVRGLGAACCLAITAAASAQPVLPQAGLYLSSAYVAALEKTKSHLAAANATAIPQAVKVSRDEGGGMVLDSVVGFYEEATAVYDPKTPTVFEEPEGGAKKPFIWGDATHFKIGRGKGPLTYRYIGNEDELLTGTLQHFLIGKLLAGIYTDARGQKYVFGADGKAQFPGRTFPFELLTNTLDEEWDQIIAHTGAKDADRNDIAFAWRGKALFLYTCDPAADTAGCTPDRKHPIAVLHKVR